MDEIDGKERWRLCYAKDEDEARVFLESRGLAVHAIEPYDFSEVWLEKAQEETQAVVAAYQAGQAWDFKPLWIELREHLLDLFQGKCAYCEADISYTGLGDVDQYRPKGKVAEDEDHPGYYWLAYDPENYLPSCQRCNQFGKRNHFPIGGVRAYEPGDSLEDEEALLLNPYLDDYSEHLAFVPSVKLDHPGLAVGISEKGKATIEILDLNRPELVQMRRKEQANVRAAFKQAFMQAVVSEGPEAITDLLSEITRRERQFCTAAVCEIDDYYARIGFPPPSI
jgi:uncharacterized protein (TIGR02646 family)